MSSPIVDVGDLGTYLNDTTINEARAQLMIDLAQTECENVIGPLPVSARPIVMRVAARGYVSTTQARSSQLAAAGSPFGAQPAGASGIYVTSKDEYDLIRLTQTAEASGVSAFTMRLTPPRHVVDSEDFRLGYGYGYGRDGGGL